MLFSKIYFNVNEIFSNDLEDKFEPNFICKLLLVVKRHPSASE